MPIKTKKKGPEPDLRLKKVSSILVSQPKPERSPYYEIEVVEIGKQLLMTRGTLTTFSIANDVAKYFAIIPALFIVGIPSLQGLNIMQLHSPESAILSAVILKFLYRSS